MAAKQVTIKITSLKEAQQTLVDRTLKAASKPRTECVALSNYFDAMGAGNRDGSFTVEVSSGDEVAATGTVTFSSFAAADTFTIGTQTFTASASPSGANQFLVTGGDTVAAAAAVVAINAHASLKRVVTATSALGVITLTCFVSSLVGNQIGLAISAHGSVSASKMSGGLNATTYSAKNTYHTGG